MTTNDGRSANDGEAKWLFIPQTLHRISNRRFDGLEAHRQQSNQQRQSARQRKYPPADFNAVSKILQSAPHGKPGQRGSDQGRQGNQDSKIFGEQEHNAGNGSAQHFADANLFGALFRNKRRQATFPSNFLEKGRFPVYKENLKLLKKKVGEDLAMFGESEGAFTCAANLVGTEQFIEMVYEKSRFSF